MYIALYGPTSVQRIIDFLKTVYALGGATPVIIKPVGAAAQIGVPEAHKIAYKLGKPLIVLPEITDLKELFKPPKIYYIANHGKEVELSKELLEAAIIIRGGEQEPSKKELANVELIKIKDIPAEISPIALTGILLYMRK